MCLKIKLLIVDTIKKICITSKKIIDDILNTYDPLVISDKAKYTEINEKKDVSDDDAKRYDADHVIKYERYYNTCIEASKMINNTLMAIDTGAIVLSITFISQMHESISKAPLGYMEVAWGCFAFSLIISLLSQHYGYKMISTELTLEVETYHCKIGNRVEEDRETINRLEFDTNRYNSIALACNMLQMITTITGIILLMVYIFIAMNLIDNKWTNDYKVIINGQLESSPFSIRIMEDTMSNKKDTHVIIPSRKESVVPNSAIPRITPSGSQGGSKKKESSPPKQGSK